MGRVWRSTEQWSMKSAGLWSLVGRVRVHCDDDVSPQTMSSSPLHSTKPRHLLYTRAAQPQPSSHHYCQHSTSIITSGQGTDKRPHRRRTWTVQWYSPGCASVHPRLTHASSDHASPRPNGISIGAAVSARLTSVTDRQTDHATLSVTRNV